MTIVFRTTWQHYSPGQQADLGSTEETRLIGLGLADDFSQASQDAATSPPGELPVLSAGQYAAPTSMPAGVLYLSPAGAVVVRKPGEAVWSPVSGGGIVTISANVTINAANADTYDGKTLVWLGAFVVTLNAGLPSGFGFSGRPPASGNASVAVAGGATIDGLTTTITRALAANKLFAVQGIAADTYTATGT